MHLAYSSRTATVRLLTIVCNAPLPHQPKGLFWARRQCAPQSECQSSSGEVVVKIGKGQVSFSGLTLHTALFTPDLFYQSHAGTQPSWSRCVLAGRHTLLLCDPPDWSQLIPERNTSRLVYYYIKLMSNSNGHRDWQQGWSPSSWESIQGANWRHAGLLQLYREGTSQHSCELPLIDCLWRAQTSVFISTPLK